MTLECIIIPAWLLGVMGFAGGMLGVYLGRIYISVQDCPFLVMLVAAICILLGFSTTLAVIIEYTAPVILPLLPCIVVIP